MRKQGLLYSAAILCASNLGLQGLGFLYRIGVSRFAGAEGLGIFHLAYSVYAVIHAACLSGVGMACSRMSAELSAAGQKGAIGNMAKRAAQTFTLLLCVGAVVLFLWRHPIAQQILGDMRTTMVFPVMIACLALTGVENIVKAICIGLDQVEWAASAELTEQIVRIVSVLGLLAVFGGQNTAMVAVLIFVGMCLSECVSATMLARIYQTRIRVPKPMRKPLPAGFSREFLAIIVPVTGAALLNNLLASSSSVILPSRLILAGLNEEQAISELGIISGMAMPLLIFPMAMISSLCTVVMPAISKSRAMGSETRIASLTYKTISITGLLGIPLTALLVPLAPTLSRLFFGQPLTLSYVVLLGIETIFIYYQMVTAGLLHGLGLQKQAVTAAVAGEVVQLIGVWFLAAIPMLGIYGYILAQILASTVTVGRNFYILFHKVPLIGQKTELFATPILCGITIFLWVRVLYTFFLGLVGFQWLGVVCTVCSSSMLCLGLLHLLGVRLQDYIQPGKSRPTNLAFLWGLY